MTRPTLSLSVLLVCSLLAGCSSVGEGINTGVQATLETALSPIDVLTGHAPYANTRAQMRIDEANSRISEWLKIQATGDLQKMLAYRESHPSLTIDWVPMQDLIPDMQAKQKKAMDRYGHFLAVMGYLGEFKTLDDRALGSHSDQDINALVYFVRVKMKGNHTFMPALDEPSLRDREEGAVFAVAQKSGGAQNYQQYLALYPNGEHAGEARRNLEQIAFNNAIRNGSTKALADFLTRYPNGSHAGDAHLALGKQYAQGSGPSYLEQHRQAAQFFKLAADEGSAEAPALLQNEQTVIAAEAQAQQQEQRRLAEEDARQQALYRQIADALLHGMARSGSFSASEPSESPANTDEEDCDDMTSSWALAQEMDAEAYAAPFVNCKSGTGPMP